MTMKKQKTTRRTKEQIEQEINPEFTKKYATASLQDLQKIIIEASNQILDKQNKINTLNNEIKEIKKEVAAIGFYSKKNYGIKISL